ncbi:MAG TPA: DUF2934 domain-containing protein [Vicinamibacterales bacterium]
MAKSTNGGTTKRTSEETRARRAPERRRTKATTADGAIASAPDLAAVDVAAQRRTDRIPSHEEVQRLAFELYVRRGGAPGSHLDDWYEAERRLRSRTR